MRTAVGIGSEDKTHHKRHKAPVREVRAELIKYQPSTARCCVRLIDDDEYLGFAVSTLKIYQ